jgi:hypothetical protein
MKITREKEAIKIYEEGVTIFFNRNADSIKSDPSTNTYVLGHKGEGNISAPGEYEFAQFGLIAVEAKAERDNQADLYKIELDGVNLLIKAGPVQEMIKEDFDLFGEVNVLVLFGSDDDDEISRLLKKVTPQMVIFVDYDKAKVENTLNIQIAEEEKTIKLKHSDFTNEDVAQRYVGLIK